MEHPGMWDNEYLIYLYADVGVWKRRLDALGAVYSEFSEPDMGGAVTAVATVCDGRMFRNLDLVK